MTEPPHVEARDAVVGAEHGGPQPVEPRAARPPRRELREHPAWAVVPSMRGGAVAMTARWRGGADRDVPGEP
ncbi:hypothetical protein [Streptomyces phaeoluteigriseus]